MIKVSVIVPVDNGEKTIKACIDSILNQTMKDIEIIVVNDGSEDGTESILESYKDNITVLSERRIGQGGARNAGIKAAKGEYVGFVDADDTIEKDMYRVMYEAAKKDDYQIVQCGIHDIREDGSVTERAAFDRCVEIKDRGDYIFEYFYRNKHTFEVCNKLIKRSFLLENKLKFGSTVKYFSEDLKLNTEMLLYVERVRFLDKCFYNYYIKNSGHCLGDLVGRVPKILGLFENVLNNSMDTGTRKSLECVAALVLLLYCRAAADEDLSYAAGVLKNPSLRKYIKTSMTYRSNFRHFCLYFLINYAPSRVSLLLLHIFMKY